MRNKWKLEFVVALCLACFLCGCADAENSVEEASTSGWETITESAGSEMLAGEGSTVARTTENVSTESQDDWNNTSDSEDSSDESTSDRDSIPAAYGEILDTMRVAMKKEGEAVLDMDTDYLPVEFYQGYPVGYALQDIDENGTDELILEIVDEQYGNNSIYAIFTLSNDAAVQVVNYGGVRNRYYICTDGTVENQGSSGASYSNWSYYKLIDKELILQECVFTYPGGEDGTEICWYYTTTDPNNDFSKEITAEEATEITDSYTEVELDVTTLG